MTSALERRSNHLYNYYKSKSHTIPMSAIPIIDRLVADVCRDLSDGVKAPMARPELAPEEQNLPREGRGYTNLCGELNYKRLFDDYPPAICNRLQMKIMEILTYDQNSMLYKIGKYTGGPSYLKTLYGGKSDEEVQNLRKAVLHMVATDLKNDIIIDNQLEFYQENNPNGTV